MTRTASPLRFPFPDAPDPTQAIEVAPGIRWLRLPLPMALDHVNCYALEDDAGWTLVDTGLGNPQSQALWQGLMAGALGAKPVTRLIVTHHHPDHIGLAGWFQRQGVELLTTRTAWLYARMLTLDVQPLPTAEALLFYQRAGLDAAQLAAMTTKRPFNFADVVSPLPLGFTRIGEGYVLTAAGRRWQVRLGHGHAPDHAMLFSLDDNLILAGDQLLPTISANIGVYPTEPADDPLTAWLASTRGLMPHARDDHLVLPGHKLPYFGLPCAWPKWPPTTRRRLTASPPISPRRNAQPTAFPSSSNARSARKPSEWPSANPLPTSIASCSVASFRATFPLTAPGTGRPGDLCPPLHLSPSIPRGCGV